MATVTIKGDVGPFKNWVAVLGGKVTPKKKIRGKPLKQSEGRGNEEPTHVVEVAGVDQAALDQWLSVNPACAQEGAAAKKKAAKKKKADDAAAETASEEADAAEEE